MSFHATISKNIHDNKANGRNAVSKGLTLLFFFLDSKKKKKNSDKRVEQSQLPNAPHARPEITGREAAAP